MPKRYVFEITGEEKIAICDALHLAYEEARKLARREAAMGINQRFVISQQKYARQLQNLFFRFINAKAEPEETDSEEESTSSREE